MKIFSILAAGLMAPNPANATDSARSPAPVSLQEYLELARPAPSLELSYGAAPEQGVSRFGPPPAKDCASKAFSSFKENLFVPMAVVSLAGVGDLHQLHRKQHHAMLIRCRSHQRL